MRAHMNVMVFGSGPLGLLCMAVAKAYGARTIIASDVSEKRVNFAKSYAATHAFVGKKRPEDKEIMEWNREQAAEVLKDAGVSGGVDLVIEASGAEPCMQLGMTMLRHGGTCEPTSSQDTRSLQRGVGAEMQIFKREWVSP